MNKILIYTFLLPILFSCTCGHSGSGSETAEPLPKQEPAEVASSHSVTAKLPVSKGIIRSNHEVKVFSTIEGQLLEVNLLEGRRVRKGDVLFKLDDSEILDRIALCESEYDQAKLKMQEILIGQGYKRDSLDAVPDRYKEYARIKSGVNVKQRELELNRALLKRTEICASQSGLLTLINANSYDFVKPGNTLCTIIDPKDLIVEFSILETEIRRFKVGTVIEVRAIAYPDAASQATVRSIGTVVDAGGLIKVEATIAKPGQLVPGMTAIINLYK